MSKQQIVEKEKDKREGKGHVLAISRRLYRLQNSDVYYVESESRDNNYYFVKFKPDGFESSWWCSCKDNSTSHLKCKHIFAIEFSIKWGTLKDIDTIPSLVTTTLTSNELGLPNFSLEKLGQPNNNNNTNTNKTIKIVAPPSISKSPSSYKDDDYSF